MLHSKRTPYHTQKHRFALLKAVLAWLSWLAHAAARMPARLFSWRRRREDKRAEQRAAKLEAAALEGDLPRVERLLTASKSSKRPPGPSELAQPLWNAVAGGHADVVALLASAGAAVDRLGPPDSPEPDCAPVWAAARLGHADVVAVLVAAGAAADDRGLSDATPLWIAAHNGHVDAVKALLAALGVDAGAVGRGLTPAQTAAMRGHFDVARLLLERQAAAAGSPAPLWDAVLLGTPDDVGVALSHPTPADDASGFSPLCCAALRRQDAASMAIARELLRSGCDADAAGAPGMPTPLSVASGLGHQEMVELLIQHGADAGGALVAAAAGGHAGVVRTLLLAGADVHRADANGRTPLYAAARAGRAGVVALLLQRGADPHARTRSGFTPLNAAAVHGHLNVVRALASHEPGLGRFLSSDDHGRTALHLAAALDRVDVLRELLDAGAYVERRDGDGRTPLDHAAAGGAADAAAFLLEHGASLSLLERPLALRLLRSLQLSSEFVNSDEFSKAVQNMSVVAVMLVSLSYVAWLNPPGGFSDGLSMLDPSAIQACRAAEALAPGTPATESHCGGYTAPLKVFFFANSITFYLAMVGLGVAMGAGLPERPNRFFQRARGRARRYRIALWCLILSMLSCVVAFGYAGTAVLPPKTPILLIT